MATLRVWLLLLGVAWGVYGDDVEERLVAEARGAMVTHRPRVEGGIMRKMDLRRELLMTQGKGATDRPEEGDEQNEVVYRRGTAVRGKIAT